MRTDHFVMGCRWLPTMMLVLLLLVVSACGGGGQPAAAPTGAPAAAEPTEAPADEDATPETEPAGDTPASSGAGAIGSLDDVEQAVIRIEAEGTFATPGEGMVTSAGSGSGFLIDSDGTAVTNNHVVTGAAFIRVYVGDSDEPVNAQILGTSECSDLAVIDLDGDGYPYLDWYDDELKTGLDVFAAGFPLGDPEFTLTRGIISKENADGETPWASVDRVLEHDARINPGNSGGPLVTEDGQLVGVNYAGNSDVGQFFAIGRDEALALIEDLKESDVTSIGVNGEAFVGDSSSGIWVASVKSGSPADQVGIEPGDIIVTMERLPLASDGTMADYCDILRSRDSTTPMAIEVVRPATEQVLEGTLNQADGDLVETFSFAVTESDELVAPADDTGSTDAGSGEVYLDYVQISDDSGSLVLEVPAEWSDVDGTEWVGDSGDRLGPAVQAAPDLESFLNTAETPGVIFVAFDLPPESQDPAMIDELIPEALDQFEFAETCTYEGREDYSDGLYQGQYDVWSNCNDVSSMFVVAFRPEDSQFMGLVLVQAISEADLEALDRIIQTFKVVGEL
ncbi:MAG: trypsin-like serine protease [Chloroflexaceae bacterium]|nr:trypsin-like serine protease [Chloroflexaceae bacterium]